MIKFGYIRSDEDCHDYLVPENLVPAFDCLMEQIEATEFDTEAHEKLCCDMDDIFGCYRLDGDLYDLRVVME